LASIRTDKTIPIHAGSLGFDGAFRGILSLIPTTAINIQNKTTESNNKKVCQYNVQWAAQQTLGAVLYKVT
jgi:hypothetical protein